MRLLCVATAVMAFASCSFLVRFDPNAQACPCLAGYTCTDGGCVLDVNGNPDASTSEAAACTDTFDNDGDGLTDCADSDCATLACDDHNPCTTGETCQSGVCGGGALRQCALPDSPCIDGASGTCDPATGECTYATKANGAACSSNPMFQCCRGACTDIVALPCNPIDGGTASCLGTPWGTVPHGFSGTTYSARHPQGMDLCSELLQVRACFNGTLSGSYTEVTCANYACNYSDAGFQLGLWYVTGLTGTSSWQSCQSNGQWSGSQSPPYPQPTTGACEWGNVWFPQNTCGFYDGMAFICESSAWKPEPSRCPLTP